jgi:ADYC domain
MRACLTLAVLSAGMLLPSLGWGQATFADVRAVGTEFRIALSDGRVLTSADLIGAVLSVTGPDGHPQTVRIDAVEPDPSDPDHDILLHTLSVQNPTTEAWQNLCEPGSDGVAKAFPLSGRWTKDGRHLPDEHVFTLICTGGAIGKCIRWGYKPWRSAANGESLWDYHQACVRMVRADYGGDGIGHTRDDTPIDVFDRLDLLQPATDPGKLSFEAAWGVDGAVCVRKPRIAEIVSLVRLEEKYPHLRGHTGEICREDKGRARALVLNRS